MGLSITCKKCNGTGDMGMIASSRCNACHGSGKIEIDDADEEILFEFIEGLLDEDTDQQWVEKQLKKLMERKKTKKTNS